MRLFDRVGRSNPSLRRLADLIDHPIQALEVDRLHEVREEGGVFRPGVDDPLPSCGATPCA